MSDKNYSPYQQKIIKRYYDNQPQLLQQRLAELVGELYLASEKKKKTLWASVGEMLPKLGLPASRVEHLMSKADPALLADVVKELERK